MEKVGTAPDPAQATADSDTFSAADTKTVDFGKITFRAAGKYEYKVKETVTAATGWTFDPAEKTVTIEIGTDDEGKLIVKDVKGVAFTNTYDVTPPTPPTPSYYTIRWVNDDGAVLEIDQNVQEGTIPTYDGATPTKPADEQNTYTFSGWTPQVVAVTGNATYTATYTAEPINYTVTYEPGTHGTFATQTTTDLKYGDATPAAPAITGEDGYEFTGWRPSVAATVTGNATYVAQWKKVNDDDDDDDEPTPTPTPTPPAPGRPAGGNPGGPAPAGPGVVPAAPAADGTPIADDAVPQAEPEAEPEADIPDDATPLAEGTWAVLNLIAAILTTLGAVVALFRKKEEDDDEDDQKKDDDEDDNRGKKMLAAKIAGAVAGVAAPITFFLTEDMSLPMAMTDKWTLLMVVFLAAQVVTAVLNKKASELDDEKEEEAEAAN